MRTLRQSRGIHRASFWGNPATSRNQPPERAPRIRSGRSPYHIEAAIATEHAAAASVAETNGDAIVALYDRLMVLAPSPVVALNRAIAIGQRDGPERGLDALGAITDRERLRAYPFYAAALGEVEYRRGNLAAARRHFASAIELARSRAERRFLERRVRECVSG